MMHAHAVGDVYTFKSSAYLAPQLVCRSGNPQGPIFGCFRVTEVEFGRDHGLAPGSLTIQQPSVDLLGAASTCMTGAEKGRRR